MRARHSHEWRTKEVWAIAGSAFFADLGYQAVLAGFPLFLVLTLHLPVWEYGVATALSYGGGSVFSYVGGRLGDRYGHRRIALIGNSLIPLLALSAISSVPAVAIGLMTGGWWFRNLRSPSRRAMLTAAVPAQQDRPRAFGFLHALDVGGGALAGVYLLIAVSEHVEFRWIFLGAVIPLVLSTLSLAQARVDAPPAREPADQGDEETGRPPGSRALFAAAALYGFTFYSVGFPVLTIAQGAGDKLAAGVGAFLVLQLVSAVTGYVMGPHLGKTLSPQFVNLGVLGYGGAGVGAGVIALAAADHLALWVFYVGVAVIGFALGIIEILEPSAIAQLRPSQQHGRGFGSLSGARGVGAFVSNLAMGLLYSVGVAYAYLYAAILAIAAGLVILGVVPRVRRWGGFPGESLI